MFEILLNSSFLYSVSLTLVHFLWQGFLVALILKLLLFIVDKKKPKLRYTLAILAMLANATLALLTYNIVSSNSAVNFDNQLSHIVLTNLVNELTQQNALFTSQQLLPSMFTYSLPYLSLLWLTSVAILAFKLLIEIRNVNNLPRQSSILPSTELSTRFNLLAKQLQLSTVPRLLISLTTEVPMAIGWLKPVVLLPATMVTGLTPAQLEMLILHELAHIRRHDYLVNFLQTVIELLFFFHPSVHWVGKQIRNEREYCSDDIAVHHCGDAIAYAHTLTDTASLCAKNNLHTIPTMAMAASGGDLKTRVLRLVDHHCAPTNNTSKLLAALSLLLTLILLMINQLLTTSFAQQPSHQWSKQEPLSINENLHTEAEIPATLTTIYNKKTDTTVNYNSIAQQHLKRNTTDSVKTTEFVDEIIDGFSVNLPVDNAFAIAKVLQTRKDNASSPITKAIIEAHTTHNAQQDINQDSTFTKAIAASVKQAPIIVSNEKIHRSLPIETANVDHDSALTKPLLSKQSAPHQAIPAITTGESLTRATSNHKITESKTEQTLLAVEKTADKHKEKKNLLNSNVAKKPLSTNSVKQNPLTVSTTPQPNKTVSATASSLDATLLTSINPIYPNLAKRRGIEMEVTVDFTIDRNGKVKDINFTHQSKLIYFKSAIRSAIRQWRFNPAIKNNRKIESKMTKIFSFSLHA